MGATVGMDRGRAREAVRSYTNFENYPFGLAMICRQVRLYGFSDGWRAGFVAGVFAASSLIFIAYFLVLMAK